MRVNIRVNLMRNVHITEKLLKTVDTYLKLKSENTHILTKTGKHPKIITIKETRLPNSQPF